VSHGADAQARADMLLAAYAGGVSIGMGLGPAHAIALTCSDQGFHHGVLSGIGLVATLDATAARAPARVAAVAAAFGVPSTESLARAVASLMRELGLPATLAELGYAADDVQALADAAHRSYFNVFAPFHPSAADYRAMIASSLGRY
jgi:alcohol dehydrogenase class IV